MTQRRRQRHKYFEARFPHLKAGFAIRKTGFDAGLNELISKRLRSLP